MSLTERRNLMESMVNETMDKINAKTEKFITENGSYFADFEIYSKFNTVTDNVLNDIRDLCKEFTDENPNISENDFKSCISNYVVSFDKKLQLFKETNFN